MKKLDCWEDECGVLHRNRRDAELADIRWAADFVQQIDAETLVGAVSHNEERYAVTRRAVCILFNALNDSEVKGVPVATAA